MLLLGVRLLPAGHLGKVGKAHAECFLEVRVGEVLVKAGGVASGGVCCARLQCFQGKLCGSGQALLGGRRATSFAGATTAVHPTAALAAIFNIVGIHLVYHGWSSALPPAVAADSVDRKEDEATAKKARGRGGSTRFMNAIWGGDAESLSGRISLSCRPVRLS